MNDSVSLENEELEAQVAEATDAFLDQVQSGEPVDVEVFIQDYPRIAGILRELLPAMQVIQESSSSGCAAGPLGIPDALGSLGDFRLLREIGRGGMGIVYEAEQQSLGRRVALKMLPMAAALDPRHLQRFRLEAQAAAQLHHPHIVPIYSIGCERGVYYYAMQYIEGQSLAEVITQLQKQGQAEAAAVPVTTQIYQRGAGADPQEDCPPEPVRTAATTVRSIRSLAYFQSAVRLAIQAADALEYAHDMGVIHRDIKPANLLRNAQGNIFVTDFGLAQLQGVSGLTRTGDLVGTLRYMSPEQVQANNSLDQRTDVYSLGATLYELLTLTPAFEATERPRLLRQIAEEEPWPPRFHNSVIPIDLETIVLKAMAKEPGRRYGTAKELADDLRRFLEDRPIKARRPTPLQRIAKWSRRHRPLVAAAIGMLLLTVVGLAVGTMLEQSQTKKALLRVSEERDRANKALADAETQRADAETQRGHRLELAFGAKEKIDSLAELCDRELRDKPELQELRRKVLESVLEYYQDFIDSSQFSDAPDLQEKLLDSYLRVAVILDDFGDADKALQTLEKARTHAEKLCRSHPDHPSVLAFHHTASSICSQFGSAQSSREVHLLSQPAVQAELKLTADQVKKLAQLAEKRHEPPGKGRIPSPEEWREWRTKYENLSNPEKVLANLLQPEQAKRLRQIALQQRGLEAFKDPTVVKILQLTEEQKGKIRMILEGGHHSPPMAPRRGIGPLGGGKKGAGPRNIQEQILSVLTTRQKEVWQELIGRPFEGEIRSAAPRAGSDLVTTIFKNMLRRPPVRGIPDPRHNPMPPPWGGRNPESV